MTVTVDGLAARYGDWTEVRVLSGRHRLEFQVGECMLQEREASLRAGETYTLEWRVRFGGECSGHLQDAASRDAVAWKDP